MAKKPDKRWQVASDVMAELMWVTEGDPDSSPVLAVATISKWKIALPWSLVAVMIVITSVVIWSSQYAPSTTMTANFSVNLPTGDNFAVLAGPTMAISHDGRHLIYVANRNGRDEIFHRALDQAEAVPIGDTLDARRLFFSPDDQWVGFQARSKLQRIPLTGGAPLPIADAERGNVVGASWGSDGNIIVGGSLGLGLSVVSDTGGTLEAITTPDTEKGERSHLWPQILPGGHAVLFTIRTTASHDDARIGVLSLDTGEWHTVWQGGFYGRYSPTGHLLYVRSETLMAVPFSLADLEVSGDPIPVLPNVRVNQGSGHAHFALSDDGTIIFRHGTGTGGDTLFLANRQGEKEHLTTKPVLRRPQFSPDGKSLAVTVSEQEGFEGRTTWIYDLSRKMFSPLALEGNIVSSIWRPDGDQLTFTTGSSGGDIFQIPLDGSGLADQLTMSESLKRPWAWSPDGKFLALQEGEPGDWDIRVQVLGSGEDSQPFLVNQFDERHPMFSPDGRWIAFTSDRSGQDEIYAKPYGREGDIVRISTGGGIYPVWPAKGKELFYLNGNQIMVVEVQDDPELTVGMPKVLFESDNNIVDLDVSPDGQQFALRRSDLLIPTQINVILNWFEELKRLVPTDN
jgi:serine/threonine-protein kinase